MDDEMIRRHVQFLNRCLLTLPVDYLSIDSSKLTVLFFSLSSLDLLNRLHELRVCPDELIDFIYSFQIKEDPNVVGAWGFRGTHTNGKDHKCDFGHLTMIYAALNSLLILNDDWGRLDRSAIIRNLHQYQLKNGNFVAALGEESDLRFVYCAASICYLLNDWSGINVDKMVDYIRSCLTYEGGFGQCPNNEAHGGSTYCAVASLMLAGRLHEVLDEQRINHLIRWCVNRQTEGFNGRPNKDADTCYTFWIGATLRILGAHDLVDQAKLCNFVLGTQHMIVGGLAKNFNCSPDPLHTCLGFGGMSLFSEQIQLGLEKINPELNISSRAFEFWKNLPITTDL